MSIPKKEVRFTVHLGAHTHKSLKIYAASENISMQWIVNMAIENLLTEEGSHLSENNSLRKFQNQKTSSLEGVSL